MKVNKSKNGNTLQVSVEGRVDTATAPRFDAEVKTALSGITELVIDFSELDYISSAGLRVLLSLQKTMNSQGSIKITGVNETVNEVLEITGFSDILTIE
jgi:anti-sigma B factor antagonist